MDLVPQLEPVVEVDRSGLVVTDNSGRFVALITHNQKNSLVIAFVLLGDLFLPVLWCLGPNVEVRAENLGIGVPLSQQCCVFWLYCLEIDVFADKHSFDDKGHGG